MDARKHGPIFVRFSMVSAISITCFCSRDGPACIVTVAKPEFKFTRKHYNFLHVLRFYAPFAQLQEVDLFSPPNCETGSTGHFLPHISLQNHSRGTNVTGNEMRIMDYNGSKCVPEERTRAVVDI